MPSSEKDALKRAEVQLMLGCSSPTITKLIRDGAFPNAFQINTQYRIPRGDVEAYLRKRRVSKKTAAA